MLSLIADFSPERELSGSVSPLNGSSCCGLLIFSAYVLCLRFGLGLLSVSIIRSLCRLLRKKVGVFVSL